MVAETAHAHDDLQQAINEALRIAMREDPTVILLGEDIAGGAKVDHLVNDDAWGGPMGVTKGLVQEFGRDRVLDTPDHRGGFHRRGRRRGRHRPATGGRADVRRLLRLLHGPDLRPGRQAALHVRRQGKVPGRRSAPMIGAGVSAAGQHSGCHYSVFTHMPGIKMRRAVDAGRRQGAAC